MSEELEFNYGVREDGSIWTSYGKVAPDSRHCAGDINWPEWAVADLKRRLKTPEVLGHPATASWCAAVDDHHTATEGYNWKFCRLVGQDAPPGDIDGALEKLTEIKAQRDDYAERLIKVASVLEPHWRGASPKGAVPTWGWIVKEYEDHIKTLMEDYGEEITALRAALAAKEKAQ